MALTDLFKKKKKNRSCVVGLDGVPHSLILRFIEQGVFKFLGELSQKGHLSKMKVTLPEISAVSWPSFMTGTNPGVHGIFGFTDIRPGTYQTVFPMFLDLKTKTFWDKLGESGKFSVVINQPGTYPARAIPGVLISGFVAIELNKAVQPMKFLAPLRRVDYQIDIDTQRCRRDHDQLFRELDKTLEGRRAIVDHLWRETDWDYFQVVITGTDRLQHYLFSAIADQNHPRHGQAMEYYKKIDAFIAEMWERFHKAADVAEEGLGFFLLSDHGFTLIEQEVYLNAWLRQEGFLKFGKDQPESLADIGEEARAFVLDPGRIYIHRQDKYPNGRVSAGDAETLKKEIREKLLDLTYNNKKVVEMVVDRDEAYQGPLAEHGPDLVVVGNWGFDLKGSLQGDDIFRRTDLTGMHTWNDAFFWSKKEVKSELNITDLASIVMSACVPA